jgi:hypothetical protein
MCWSSAQRPALVTRDFDFGDIRTIRWQQYAGLVVPERLDDAVVTFLLRVMESFVSQKN